VKLFTHSTTNNLHIHSYLCILALVLQTYVAMQQIDYQWLNAPTYSSNAAQFTFNTEGSIHHKRHFDLSEKKLKEVFNAFYEAEILIDLTRFTLSEGQLCQFLGQAYLRESLKLRPIFIQTPNEIEKIWGERYLYECENPQPTPIIFEQKALNDYQISNLDLFVVERSKALDYIANLKGKKVIICEESYIDTAKKAVNNAIVLTYKDASKLNIDEDVNVYVFGSQNFARKFWRNSANEIEKLAKRANVILFADTPIYLNIANHINVIEQPSLNAQVIVADNPSATFVESVLACCPEDVLFLETHESVNKQLADFQQVKRSELYAADHDKPLFVLYDSAVGLLPKAFSQFKNVVFIANNETKPCLDMSTFCDTLATRTRAALDMLDNDLYKGETEKMFFEAVKSGTLPIRRKKNGWERCPNTEGSLEYEHQVKCLVSDAGALKRHIEGFAKIHVKAAETSTATAEIIADIKQSKIDIAAEKKTEFFEFLQDVEDKGIESLNDLKVYVANRETMSRGAKIAYNRLKTLSKVNPNFVTCFDAVKDSYVGWTKTKGRFCAAKIIKTDTKTGTVLQIFRDTTEGNNYTKTELLDIARAILPINGNDAEAWKQIKRMCHLPNKQVMKEGNRGRLYEVIFLE
jgi:hypothetical protein